jgi:hypothetical protein
MSESPQTSKPTLDVVKLARAIRFSLVAIVIGLSYFPIRISLNIHAFEQIFTDMLGGKPLPALTLFVLKARAGFIVVSFCVPLIALATLFFRNVLSSFYILGVLTLIPTIECVVLLHGCFAPLFQIISSMSGAPNQ